MPLAAHHDSRKPGRLRTTSTTKPACPKKIFCARILTLEPRAVMRGISRTEKTSRLRARLARVTAGRRFRAGPVCFLTTSVVRPVYSGKKGIGKDSCSPHTFAGNRLSRKIFLRCTGKCWIVNMPAIENVQESRAVFMDNWKEVCLIGEPLQNLAGSPNKWIRTAGSAARAFILLVARRRAISNRRRSTNGPNRSCECYGAGNCWRATCKIGVSPFFPPCVPSPPAIRLQAKPRPRKSGCVLHTALTSHISLRQPQQLSASHRCKPRPASQSQVGSQIGVRLPHGPELLNGQGVKQSAQASRCIRLTGPIMIRPGSCVGILKACSLHHLNRQKSLFNHLPIGRRSHDAIQRNRTLG